MILNCKEIFFIPAYKMLKIPAKIRFYYNSREVYSYS